MADDIIVGPDLDSAAAAIEKLLDARDPAPVPAQAQTPDPAPQPAPAAQPEPVPDSPQAGSQPQPDSGVSAASDAQAPAAVPSAPSTDVQPAKAPTVSPDVEQMRAEAAKKVQEAETVRSQFLNALNTYIPQLESAVRGEFADIKTPEDVLRLAETDVARYNRFQIAQMRLQQATFARTQAVQVEQAQQQEQFAKWRQAEGEKIGSLIPELKDPDKGPSLARKLNDFALKQGYTAEQLSRASATDFAVLHQAMQATDLKAQIEAAKQKAAKAPPVQEPGTRPTNSSKESQIQTDYARLQKTGDLDDAARLFGHLIN